MPHELDFPKYGHSYRLPDGTPLPRTAVYGDGAVHDWTGVDCRRCNGTGEHVHPFDAGDRHTCNGCGGTGEAHGPTWRWEE